ncbi:MAG: hypothetical protein IJL70_04270 [Treponema sp.]|nr:hypothetical protein [Treponema sp.]
MKNRLLTVISATFIFLLSILLPAVLNAEEITDNDFNFSLDLPEGFKVAGYTPDGMSYQFRHDRLPVDFVMKIYNYEETVPANKVLAGTLKKLSATYEGIGTFTWSNRICAITTFSSKATSKNGSKGWATGIPLRDGETVLVLICYADAEKADDCEQFIISSINSLAIGEESKKLPGIITTYAYGGSKVKNVLLSIKGKNIQTSIDEEDAEANQFVIECEYAVLRLYAADPKWKEAWTRYYRTIFRDSYSRVQKTAFDIKSQFINYAKKKNPENPEAVINEILLEWVQEFPYERAKDQKKSDFTNLPDILQGKGSDCDSRSMLVCCIMEQLGVKSELFISREYSHAVYGADLNLPGAKIATGGKEFLLNETTAKGIKPGLMAKDMSDTEKWIPVKLP